MLILAEGGLNPGFVIGGDAPMSAPERRGPVRTGSSSSPTRAIHHIAAGLRHAADQHRRRSPANYGTFDAILHASSSSTWTRFPVPRCCVPTTSTALGSWPNVHAGFVTYGTAEDAEYRAVDISARAGSWTFDVVRRGTLLGSVHLPLRGVQREERHRGHGARHGTRRLVRGAVSSIGRFGGVAALRSSR
ncbi:MAG: hypothetical protein R2705_04070 [Ilumatobacteraceae bacterium]